MLPGNKRSGWVPHQVVEDPAITTTEFEEIAETLGCDKAGTRALLRYDCVGGDRRPVKQELYLLPSDTAGDQRVSDSFFEVGGCRWNLRNDNIATVIDPD